MPIASGEEALEEFETEDALKMVQGAWGVDGSPGSAGGGLVFWGVAGGEEVF